MNAQRIASLLRPACLLLLAWVAGCDNTDQSPLVGTWQGITQSQFGRVHNRISLNLDGSYVWQTEYPDFDREFKRQNFIDLRLLATEIAGDYSTDDDELIFEPVTYQGQLDGWAKDLPPEIAKYEYVYPFSVEDDRLILIDENGREMIFEREKGFFARWFAMMLEKLDFQAPDEAVDEE